MEERNPENAAPYPDVSLGGVVFVKDSQLTLSSSSSLRSQRRDQIKKQTLLFRTQDFLHNLVKLYLLIRKS